MAIDPETLSDREAATPAVFEGEQTIFFSDFDLREKPNGFWVLLQFSSESSERASWSGNFFYDPIDTDGRKKAHNIAWRGLREFFKALGMTDGDLPKVGPKEIAKVLNKHLDVKLAPARVKATIGSDEKGYAVASKFKAA